MSYLAVELRALEAAPHVARAAGIEEDTAVAGLLRMWAWCWREKKDHVSRGNVRGFFGADAADALREFSFLEEDEVDIYRVKGAERYLRISKARSLGGQMASGNLKRGPVKPEVEPRLPPGSSPAQAGDQPENSPGSAPALSSSIEHRASKSLEEEPIAADAAPRPPPDSHPLQELWNRHAHPDLPRWQETPEPRKKRANKALKARSLEGWLAVIELINGSAFCCGANERGWKADPDWLLQPGVATKVIEGRYQNATGKPQSRADPNFGSGLSNPVTTCADCGDVATCASSGDDLVCYPCLAARLRQRTERGA